MLAKAIAVLGTAKILRSTHPSETLLVRGTCTRPAAHNILGPDSYDTEALWSLDTIVQGRRHAPSHQVAFVHVALTTRAALAILAQRVLADAARAIEE